MPDDSYVVLVRTVSFHTAQDGEGGDDDDDEIDWMAEMLAQEKAEDQRQEEERLAFLATKASGYGADDNRATWLIEQERAEAAEELQQEREKQAFLAEKKASEEAWASVPAADCALASASAPAGGGGGGGGAVDTRESWIIDQERQEAAEEARQEEERLAFLAERAVKAEATARSNHAATRAGEVPAPRSDSDVAAVEIGDNAVSDDDETDRAVSVDVRESWLIDQEQQEVRSHPSIAVAVATPAVSASASVSTSASRVLELASNKV